jgi:hypothetical protein
MASYRTIKVPLSPLREGSPEHKDLPLVLVAKTLELANRAFRYVMIKMHIAPLWASSNR